MSTALDPDQRPAAPLRDQPGYECGHGTVRGPKVGREGTISVALILKAKGAHVETTRPDAGLYSVVWNLKVKGIGAQVVSEDGTTVLGLISERDIVRGLTEHGTKLLTLPVSEPMTSPAVYARG